MPTYKNLATYPISTDFTVFKGGVEIETEKSLDYCTLASVTGTTAEPYAIVLSTNDTLVIKFGWEADWTTVTLTAGGTQDAADIVTDINTAIGRTVAEVYTDDAGDNFVRIRDNIIYINSADSTCLDDLGIVGLLIGTEAEPYAIVADTNDTLFLKIDTPNWIEVPLTAGAARTAAQIVTDINTAFGATVADVYNDGVDNFVRLTGLEICIQYDVAANETLGFDGFVISTDTELVPIASARATYPTIIKTADTPYYNPVVNSQIVSLTAVSSPLHLPIDPLSRIIKIVPDHAIQININSIANDPGFITSDTVIYTNINQIDDLYFTRLTSDASIEVHQLKNKTGIEV